MPDRSAPELSRDVSAPGTALESKRARRFSEALRRAIGTALKAVFRIELRGLENYPLAGSRFIIVANHVSYLDAPMLACLLPSAPMFAIGKQARELWWVRPFLRFVRTIPVDAERPLNFKHMIQEVRQGRPCMIFPEGRLTYTGALMKVYEGPGFVADKADAEVLPIYIEGAQHSRFTNMRGMFRRSWLPRIVVTIGKPRALDVSGAQTRRARRQKGATQIGDMLAELAVEQQSSEITLFDALLAARRLHGPSRPLIDDADGTPVTYDRLIAGSLILGRRIASRTKTGERVGVLLPNAIGCVVTFFALQAFGRVPAMLNFASGPAGVLSACGTASVRLVLTSRRFVEKAGLEAIVDQLRPHAEVIFLEDLRASIGAAEKLRGLFDKARAGIFHRRHRPNPASPAVILFTSGTEGVPKGVALSHRNIVANCAQLRARLDFTPRDKVFNALPMFHSFGLTAGMILPVLFGVPLFLYPSPKHYRAIPEAVYATRSTILFGADTFLAGWARHAHPYDMASVRYVFAGAERLRPETRALWADKFGIRILEGYGATETAPVLTLNSPMFHKAGSVGRLVPGIQWRLDPVPGIEAGGVLHVKGPNVMLGYIQPGDPQTIVPPPAGWYETGDVVDIDADGFITIRDRMKRFAKIAGEMVGLGAVEDLSAGLWPNDGHVATALPDGQRGEFIALVTTAREATRSALSAAARENGRPELMVPRMIIPVDQIPLLPTGKVDHRAVKALAANQVMENA